MTPAARPPSWMAVVLMGVISIPEVAPGDPLEEHALKGCHSIELSAGLLHSGSSTVTVNGSGVRTDVSGRGLMGSLRYAYWVEDNLAFQVGLSLLNADASVAVSGSQTVVESATVIPMLVGVKYQPFELQPSSPLHPYVYGSVGPYFGYAAGVEVGPATVTGMRWEAALGIRLAAGLDLALSRLFSLGCEVGYLGMSDFRSPIGGRINYSGPEFSLGASLTLGRQP